MLPIKQGDPVIVGGVDCGILRNYGYEEQRGFLSINLSTTASKQGIANSSTSANFGRVDAIFGNPQHRKPYRGNLVGNIRIKYRIDDYAKVYVRDPHRIRCYLLEDMGDYVTHGIELEQTHRVQPRTSPE